MFPQRFLNFLFCGKISFPIKLGLSQPTFCCALSLVLEQIYHCSESAFYLWLPNSFLNSSILNLVPRLFPLQYPSDLCMTWIKTSEIVLLTNRSFMIFISFVFYFRLYTSGFVYCSLHFDSCLSPICFILKVLKRRFNTSVRTNCRGRQN